MNYGRAARIIERMSAREGIKRRRGVSSKIGPMPPFEIIVHHRAQSARGVASRRSGDWTIGIIMLSLNDVSWKLK